VPPPQISSLFPGTAAVKAAEAFLNSADNAKTQEPRPFIYISAEDIFRPIVPDAYIEMKREAEERIERMMEAKTNYRGVYMRPGEILLKFVKFACLREYRKQKAE
jgi:hypothetical protein